MDREGSIFIQNPLPQKLVSKCDLPVQGDSHQGENADVDTKNLHSWAKLTHKCGQIPTLKKGSMKLEGYGKKGNCDIGKRQIGNVHFGHCSHSSGKYNEDLKFRFIIFPSAVFRPEIEACLKSRTLY